MPFKTKLKTKSVRRVVITLPEKKATALADAINSISWCETDVEAELAEFHDALLGNA